MAHPDSGLEFKPDLADDNEPLHRLLYGGRMMEFYERFLGGPVRHYDFTWMRAVAPGYGTQPHGDIVYMGRGTHDLYTAWTPLGDIDYQLGGLMILEGSHRLQSLREEYLSRDVDEYCENVEGEEEYAKTDPTMHGWRWDGSLSEDPVELREQLGGRWLTAEYRAGDLLTFDTHTIHASLDNRSERIRLSSDSRYQLASEPADERWIGKLLSATVHRANADVSAEAASGRARPIPSPRIQVSGIVGKGSARHLLCCLRFSSCVMRCRSLAALICLILEAVYLT